ncbi:MAG: hypothetical protein P0Y60_02800 [Candidatus Microbacterium colombiense]|nr:MAG: hypothetical protein P0Y60_02800 [Microbacterium sp.]
MDTTADVSRENIDTTAQDDIEEAAFRERQRELARKVSWGIAWVVPVVALIVGIWLTAVGTVEQYSPAGDGVYDVTWLAVWPAGLVLLGVGILGLTAVSLATALISTKR